jgi:cellulose synthase/poly-beta-1,6-N-acetylglucosamine synthase-like glycosyltransferase
MKISVLVPTYRRSKDLERCLEALKQQSLPADEVLVVVRDTDEQTHQFLGGFATGSLPLKIVDVVEPGQVAALNAGLKVAVGDIISITDDDAAPHKHWLEAVRTHFLFDPLVGGVGGRDWNYSNGKLLNSPSNSPQIVGKLSWFGRAVGNHDKGEGCAREVDILKGANMSYRKVAIMKLIFSEKLRGKGAQTDNDMAFSLAVKSQGWKLIYDPCVSVDHFPSERFDEDQRSQFNSIAQFNTAHNETVVILQHLPYFRKLVYLVWAISIGTRRVPGLIQILRFFPNQKWLVLRKGSSALKGRIEGVKTYLSSTK